MNATRSRRVLVGTGTGVRLRAARRPRLDIGRRRCGSEDFDRRHPPRREPSYVPVPAPLASLPRAPESRADHARAPPAPPLRRGTVRRCPASPAPRCAPPPPPAPRTPRRGRFLIRAPPAPHDQHRRHDVTDDGDHRQPCGGSAESRHRPAAIRRRDQTDVGVGRPVARVTDPEGPVTAPETNHLLPDGRHYTPESVRLRAPPGARDERSVSGDPPPPPHDPPPPSPDRRAPRGPEADNLLYFATDPNGDALTAGGRARPQLLNVRRRLVTITRAGPTFTPTRRHEHDTAQ